MKLYSDGRKSGASENKEGTWITVVDKRATWGYLQGHNAYL